MYMNNRKQISKSLKTLSILLAVLLCLAVSCGNTSSSSNNNAQTSTKSATSATVTAPLSIHRSVSISDTLSYAIDYEDGLITITFPKNLQIVDYFDAGFRLVQAKVPVLKSLVLESVSGNVAKLRCDKNLTEDKINSILDTLVSEMKAYLQTHASFSTIPLLKSEKNAAEAPSQKTEGSAAKGNTVEPKDTAATTVVAEEAKAQVEPVAVVKKMSLNNMGYDVYDDDVMALLEAYCNAKDFESFVSFFYMMDGDIPQEFMNAFAEYAEGIYDYALQTLCQREEYEKAIFVLKQIPTFRNSTIYIKALEGTLKKGDRGPAGGIIFYDKGFCSDGWRYLEGSGNKQSCVLGNTNDLYVNGTDIYRKGDCTRTEIGEGKRNTELLVKAIRDNANSDNTAPEEYAAQYCRNYVQNGYYDWYLPSCDELEALRESNCYPSLFKSGYDSVYEWSSSENYQDRSSFYYFTYDTKYYAGRGKANATPIRTVYLIDSPKFGRAAEALRKNNYAEAYEILTEFIQESSKEIIEYYHAEEARDYAKGMELFGSKKYSEALTYLERCPSYKNAASTIYICKNEPSYQAGKDYLEKGLHDEAAVCFANCLGYKDAKKLHEDYTKEKNEYKIGDKGPAGGVIVYDKGDYLDGWRYIEAAPQYLKYKYSDNDYIDSFQTYRGIGEGKFNTRSALNTKNRSYLAARACDDYSLNGYNDWFLPSLEEMKKVYSVMVRDLNQLPEGTYLTSTRYGENSKYVFYVNKYNYNSTYPDSEYVTSTYSVVPVRYVTKELQSNLTKAKAYLKAENYQGAKALLTGLEDKDKVLISPSEMDAVINYADLMTYVMKAKELLEEGNYSAAFKKLQELKTVNPRVATVTGANLLLDEYLKKVFSGITETMDKGMYAEAKEKLLSMKDLDNNLVGQYRIQDRIDYCDTQIYLMKAYDEMEGKNYSSAIALLQQLKETNSAVYDKYGCQTLLENCLIISSAKN